MKFKKTLAVSLGAVAALTGAVGLATVTSSNHPASAQTLTPRHLVLDLTQIKIKCLNKGFRDTSTIDLIESGTTPDGHSLTTNARHILKGMTNGSTVSLSGFVRVKNSSNYSILLKDANGLPMSSGNINILVPGSVGNKQHYTFNVDGSAKFQVDLDAVVIQ